MNYITREKNMLHPPLNYHPLTSRTEILDKYLIIALYSLFFLLPWYRNLSGSLQPVDCLVAITGLLLITNKRLLSLTFLKQSAVYMIMFTLALYVIARYGIAYFNDPTARDQMIANIYYLSLLTLFTYLLIYLYTTRSQQVFYQLLLNCLFITTFMPFFILLYFGKNYGLAELQAFGDPLIYRPVLSFNNANQLGFFALINLSLFFYLQLFALASQLKIKKLFSVLIININFIFLLLSASRAASPAVILYILSYALIFRPQIMKKNPYFFWGTSLILTILLSFFLTLYHRYLMPDIVLASKTVNIGFAQDIYHRAIQGGSFNFTNLYFTLFGSGSLFNPLRLTHTEFHNNFASLFNQAGLLGLLLYLTLIMLVSIKLLKKGLIYALPLGCYLIYSQLHYAYRSRMTWLFFAMIIFILLYEELKRDTRTQNRRS